MAHYDERLTLRAARTQYFEANGFGADGGYAARWVHFRIGPLPLGFPNTAARVRAVRFHDLHHIATGYDTDLRGEYEVAAWEIGGGCRTYLAAWILNFGAFMVGLLVEPRALLRAFVRGRHSRNFYDRGWSEELLEQTVGEARCALVLDRAVPAPGREDRLAFAGWGLAAGVCGIAVPIGLVWLLALLLSS